MKDNVLRVLSEQDWDSIGRKMYAMAIHWAKFSFGEKWKNLPEGHTLDDIVQDSIRRAFDHEWEDINSEVLLKYLFGSIRSVISNLARNYNNRETHTFTNLSIKGNEGESYDFDAGDSNKNSEGIEYSIDYNYYLDKISKKIEGDDKLVIVFEDIRQGFLPREISKKRNIDIKEVYSLNRKLVRLIEGIALKDE